LKYFFKIKSIFCNAILKEILLLIQIKFITIFVKHTALKKIFFTLFLFPAITFSQECNGDCENGSGTLSWDSGDKYIGQWKDNRQEGEGTYIYANGDKYVGEWKNGRQDGFGISKNKLPKKIDGNLLYEVKYVGEWKNGRKDGEGTTFLNNGQSWTGMYLNNKQLEGCFNNENCYNPSDIIGDKSSITVNLTPHKNQQQYIIKLSFGDLDEDFLFDTGASNISMSYSFLKKLKKNNIKTTNLKIKGSKAETATGETKIEYYKIDGIKIGGYTLNNTVVMVGKNISLLFGTGALEKFSDWSGPGKKGKLEIYK